MRPLRIAFCIDSLATSGGTELSTVRMAEMLAAAGHHVEVFTLRAQGDMGARYAAAGIPVHEVPVSTLAGLSTARAVRGFATRLRAGRFDVLHSHDLYTNVVGISAAWLARVPAIVASKRWTEWRLAHRSLNRAAFKLADCVLANSARVGSTLRERDGVPARRVAVVTNFVEDAAFARWTPEQRSAERQALGLPDDAPVVGIVARLRAEKDHALLLDALALVRTRVPAVRLVLVGDGEEHEALETRARALGIHEAVIFAGHRSSRPNPHQLFEVSVLCSKHEGFPNTLVEAMAAGRPVVATAVGGVPDAVIDGETGLLVPPGDAHALADAIATLLDDPSRAARMGAAGLARAREVFHASAVVPQLTRLYDDLLARARRGSPRAA